jgi:KUP system potassium uptake protein
MSEVALNPEESLDPHAHGNMVALTIGALGVVYGDIGTSPLYALKECLSEHYGFAARRETVLGLLSLMAWSLLMVITVKYLTFVMRASNRGEGGMLSLLALLPEKLRLSGTPGRLTLPTILVIFGTALLYGDGMITPAISVLSAMEGLGVATHELDRWVVPLTVAILAGLFWLQRHGTARVGTLFGPIMILWFFVIGGLGAYHIAQNPGVLAAISPHHAVRFLFTHGFMGFAVLGSVVLCITGGEALYADMGHFGVKPIRRAWSMVVMPSLLLAYFGQGALVLSRPSAADNPFYEMVPQGPATYLLVALATMAAIIASQAMISGAFSLTHQAVQLGVFPRVRVRHTSEQTEGQIYLPEINWMIAVASIALVLAFRSSTGLAAAYGIAVSGSMTITSFMFALVARKRWNWPLWQPLALLVQFLLFDLAFLSANLLKFTHGGYVPVVIAVCVSIVMATWNIGRSNLGRYYSRRSQSWEEFKKALTEQGVVRSATVGVFMASDARGVPPMIIHQAERIGAMPQTAMLITVRFEHVSWIPAKERLVEVTDLGDGFHRVVARYGFMQQPEAQLILKDAAERMNIAMDPKKVTYYLGRESFVTSPRGNMGPFFEQVFGFLSRNAMPATAYFRLPPEQVVEIGLQIDL